MQQQRTFNFIGTIMQAHSALSALDSGGTESMKQVNHTPLILVYNSTLFYLLKDIHKNHI